MRNLLLINGHEPFERAPGRLNTTMINTIRDVCCREFNIKMTHVVKGYQVKEEIEKFKWADIVVLQTPIYWFNVPGVLKTYMDHVFIPEVFFTKSNQFGRGGLLTEKAYMLSVSWGAKQKEFSASSSDFLDGYNEDQVLFPIHKTFEYCGFKQLPTFSIHSAMNLTFSINTYKDQLKEHLQSHLLQNQ
ncbi:NAD(P)H-dependent oxidoreductase [Caldalkalibacillus salinus]|uniref:NAD(P)H-dependent oxidoreductase n=1 Tax=Caldalkalibacillus salinus TaxID=2803787 RepID=UPI001922C3AE|nr:NAD(P)H-dependent oxidoreductase [Caldalkalibacillus salinus]